MNGPALGTMAADQVEAIVRRVREERDELRQERDDWRREAEMLCAEKLTEADKRCFAPPEPEHRRWWRWLRFAD